MVNRCAICNRLLSAVESLVHGIGPVCYNKILAGDFDQDKGHKVRGAFDGVFRFSRDDDGPVVNFPQVVVSHSPDGFNWGYGGSGPADTALNILLIATGGNKGLSYSLHQLFKEKFIAPMPLEGGEITLSAVKEWVHQAAPTLWDLDTN